MKQKVKKTVAWVFLIGGVTGFTLSALRLIAKDEPLIVLLLSWAALVYEASNSVFITDD